MTHRAKRCKHCQTKYYYQASGDGCFNPTNDSSYCPSCKELINEALKDVTVKFKKICLPVPIDHGVTIEIFNQKYKEWEDSVILKFYRCRYGTPENFKYKDCTINGYDYCLTTNTDTGEQLLEIEYEQNTITKELKGFWDNV